MKKYMEGKEENKVLQQGKQKALKLIFGRTMVIVALFLVQFIMIGAVVRYFGQYMPVFFGGYMSFALAIVLIIINKEGSPEIKLSWSIITLLLPVVGGLLYLFVEMQPGYRMLQRKLEHIYKRTEDFVQQDAQVLEALAKADRNTAGLASYVHKHGNFPVYQNTRVKYFPLGEDKFEAMLAELEKAEKFIFMEYF